MNSTEKNHLPSSFSSIIGGIIDIFVHPGISMLEYNISRNLAWEIDEFFKTVKCGTCYFCTIIFFW